MRLAKVSRETAVRFVNVGCGVAVTGVLAVTAGLLSRLWPLLGAGAFAFAVGVVLLADGARRVWDHWCLIWQWHGGRVHHWHRPKAEIVNCRRSAGFRVG
jgi:hypothetical protein